MNWGFNMLNFFTDPYEGELLYSTIARFHYYSGNVSMKETLLQAFGDKSVLPSIYVPSRLEYLSQQLRCNRYSADYFIKCHTVFPFYWPFMDNRRKQELVAAIKGNGGKKLFTLLGMAAGGLCRKTGLYYCPQCVNEDLQKHGEAYFHTIHQLEGVLVCDTHNWYLKEYPVLKNEISRIQFLRLETDKLDLNILMPNDNKDNNCIDSFIFDKFCSIAKAAECILQGEFYCFDFNFVHENIIAWLNNKGYVTAKGRIRQKDLCSDFEAFYRKDFLKQIECDFDKECDYSWPCELVRKPDKMMHPLRYILISLFLSGTVEALFYLPKPIAQLTKHKGVRYNADWDKQLTEVIQSGVSLREMARQMRCDPKTVIKHAKSIGLEFMLGSTMKVYEPKVKPAADYSEAVQAIRNYVRENPGCTRNEIRVKLNKYYMKLYKHQKDLLYSVLPEKLPKYSNGTLKVDWGARDIELLEKAKMAYSRLLFCAEPIRISATRLIKEIGYSSYHFYCGKLPKTKQYIESVSESVKEYQLRRVDYVCEELYRIKGRFEKWEVIRLAGLKNTVSSVVLTKINNNIMKFCGMLRGKNEESHYKELAISERC